MLNTSIEIIVIKNKATNPNNGGDCVLSAEFNITKIVLREFINNVKYTPKNFKDFEDNYKQGIDSVFSFTFANNIEIEHDYKSLTKKCKITIPRALDDAFKGSYLINFNGQSVPLFGRGDRIIVKTGYNGKKVETFRGYITNVGMGVPTILECEDMMFFLKTMEFRFSPTEKTGCASDRKNLMSTKDNTKITLKNLFKCALSGEFNEKISLNQNIFFFPDKNFSPAAAQFPDERLGIDTPPKINVYFDLDVDSDPFTYSTQNDMSIAEFIFDIKKKFPMLCIYFDDWANLRIGLLYTNDSKTFVNDTPVSFIFEKQIIDDKNMKFQIDSETNIKIIMKSARKDKGKKPLIASDISNSDKGYYGSGIGDIIRTDAAQDLTQDKLNSYAKTLYDSQKYTGWKKGSSFETFGTPVIHIGNKIKLTSDIYPEKNGTYMCSGVKTTMGMGGYRQVVSIGVKLKD